MAALALFQVSLVADAIRLHAYDWFLYVANLAGLVELKSEVNVGHGTILTTFFPWMSFPFLVLALILWANGGARPAFNNEGRVVP